MTKEKQRAYLAPRSYNKEQKGRFNPPKGMPHVSSVVPVTARTQIHEHVKRTYDTLRVGDRVQVQYTTPRGGLIEVAVGTVVPNGSFTISQLAGKKKLTPAEEEKLFDLLEEQARATCPDDNHLEITVLQPKSESNKTAPGIAWIQIPRAEIVRLKREVGKEAGRKAE